MVILLILFLFLEMYKTDPRALLHKPTDENPFFVSMFDEAEDSDSKDAKKKKKKSKSLKRKVSRPALVDQGDS